MADVTNTQSFLQDWIRSAKTFDYQGVVEKLNEEVDNLHTSLANHLDSQIALADTTVNNLHQSIADTFHDKVSAIEGKLSNVDNTITDKIMDGFEPLYYDVTKTAAQIQPTVTKGQQAIIDNPTPDCLSGVGDFGFIYSPAVGVGLSQINPIDGQSYIDFIAPNTHNVLYSEFLKHAKDCNFSVVFDLCGKFYSCYSDNVEIPPGFQLVEGLVLNDSVVSGSGIDKTGTGNGGKNGTDDTNTDTGNGSNNDTTITEITTSSGCTNDVTISNPSCPIDLSIIVNVQDSTKGSDTGQTQTQTQKQSIDNSGATLVGGNLTGGNQTVNVSQQQSQSQKQSLGGGTNGGTGDDDVNVTVGDTSESVCQHIDDSRWQLSWCGINEFAQVAGDLKLPGFSGINWPSAYARIEPILKNLTLTYDTLD